MIRQLKEKLFFAYEEMFFVMKNYIIKITKRIKSIHWNGTRLFEWLKKESSEHSQSDQIPTVQHNHSEQTQMVQHENGKMVSLYQKCTDKLSLDLVSAVDHILSDRQIVLYRISDLEHLKGDANDNISRLNSEIERLRKLIEEKEAVIRELEEKLLNKQMRYDQLIEDFKEYQDSTKIEMNDLKFQLDKAYGKYEKLQQQLKNNRTEYVQQINELEERIRELEVQNQKVTDEYMRTLEDKNRLLQSFAHFTENMSLSMELYAKPLNLPKEKPILEDPRES